MPRQWIDPSDQKESAMTRAAGLVRPVLLAALLAPIATVAGAAPGDQPVAPLPAPKPGAAEQSASATRTANIPAKGLFVGDQLSESARSKLTDLIINALGLQVEVALLVPVGPWQIDGGGHTDRDLTAARLQAVRKFLTDRGIDAKRIFVESRTDAKVTEPRLDVQLVGRPAND
jgi:OOP family OmpA-OmpF porin